MIPALFLAYEPEDVKPGWIALVLLVALGVATFLLWRSMNALLRKIQMAPRVRQRPGAPQPPRQEGQARDGLPTRDVPGTLPSAAPGTTDRSRDNGST
jgi:hypothetical protein